MSPVYKWRKAFLLNIAGSILDGELLFYFILYTYIIIFHQGVQFEFYPIKPNIALIILTSSQMKARKLFWDKYLKEDWSKYIHWWSCFQRRKNEKQKKTPESEKYVTTFSSEVGFNTNFGLFLVTFLYK